MGKIHEMSSIDDEKYACFCKFAWVVGYLRLVPFTWTISFQNKNDLYILLDKFSSK